jgi:hypothetical protein
MKKPLLMGLCILLMLGSFTTMAQSAGTYSFVASSGTFTPLSGSTVTPEIHADSRLSNAIPIGFSFDYEGVSYSYLKASSNSFINFDTTQTSSRTTNDLDGVSEPIVAPIWDDNDGRATGGSTASYLTTGTAPNRVFTMEWLNWEWRYNSTSPTISCQVKLYEGTNVIEFIYRPESGTVSSGTASIGLCGLGTGPGTFLSLSDAGASPSVSSTVETTNIGTKPATGQVYTFTPPTCLATPNFIRDTLTTTTTASVKFNTAIGSGFDFIAVYGESGSSTTNTITGITTAGSTSINLSNLIAASNYDISIRVVCSVGDTSAAGTYTFSTAYPSPIENDFSGFTGSNLSTSSPGWSEANGTPVPAGTSSSWTISNTQQQSHFGVTSARVNLYTSTRDEWLISPRVVIATGDSMKCQVAVTDYGSANTDLMGSDDSVMVLISANAGASWTRLKTFTVADGLTNTLSDYSVSLNAYAGQTVQIAIYAQDGPINDIEDYDFHVTNIFIGTPPVNDVGVTAILEPMSGCGDDSTAVKLVVYNYGSAAQTNLNVGANISGSLSSTLSTSLLSLNSNASDTIIVGYINTLTGGTYDVTAYTSLVADENNSNDTVHLSSIQIDAPPLTPSATSATVCAGSDTFLVASGNSDTYRWYKASAPDTAIHVGDTLFLNNVSATTNYEVEGFNLSTQLVGPTTAPTGSYLDSNPGRGTGFDVNVSEVTIDSVTIYPTGAGWIILNVTDYTGSTVYHTSDTIFITGTNNLTPTRVPVDLTVPYGVGIYKLTMLYSGITGMGRNSQSYPFSTTGNEFSIIGGATGTGNPTSSNNYWFYNWRVTIPGCTSPARATSTITVAPDPVVNLGNDTTFCGNSSINLTLDAGNTGSSFLWSDNTTGQTLAVTAAGTYSVTVTNGTGCTGVDTIVVSQAASLLAATSTSNVSCNGGSDGTANASATGGQSPYTYAWSNGNTTANISGLAAGTYIVTVTDNLGCTDTDAISITEPAAIVTTIASRNSSCNGASDGSATASSTGGTTPYTYLWSNAASTAGISSLPAGTYTITVTDANACTDVQNITITEPALLVASVVVDSNVSCNGLLDGGATASASGGTMPYTYLWSNSATTASITGVAAGSYSVSITDDHGCTASNSLVITEPQIPTITMTVAACSTYTWASNGRTYTMSGSYADTVVTAGMCDSIITLSLTIDTLDTTVTKLADSLYSNQVGGSYQWIDCNNGNSAVAGATSKGFRPVNSGVYAVVVTNGTCSDTSACFNLIKTGLADFGSATEANFSVFPNPSEGAISVQYSGKIDPTEAIFIYDMNGKLVYRTPLLNAKQIMDLSSLENGLYLIRYKTLSQKVIINR